MAQQQQDNTAEQLRSELKALADTLEEILHSSGDKSETELKKIKERADSMIKDARVRITETGERIVEQTKDAAQQANNYLHDKPWNGIGIAAAVGLVLGVLLSRR